MTLTKEKLNRIKQSLVKDFTINASIPATVHDINTCRFFLQNKASKKFRNLSLRKKNSLRRIYRQERAAIKQTVVETAFAEDELFLKLFNKVVC